MKHILLYIVLFGSFFAHSQQLPQYSQWSWHQFAQNPAHAGIKQCIDIHSLYRTQWVGFEGAPTSGFLTLSVPLNNRRKRYLSARHGLGLKFEGDRIGQFATNRFNVAYAAHFNFDKTNRLSLGAYAGVVQFGYDASSAITIDPDPIAMNEGSFFAPDASFGAWYNSTDFYVGLSLKNLIRSKWRNISDDSRFRVHTSLQAGYRFVVNESLTLLPGMNLRIPPKGPASLDLQAKLDYQNLLGFGIGFRNTDALIAYVQVKVKEQFSIGYSFDYTLSDIQLGAKNSHELSLRFTTCKRKRSGSSDCPLFE